MSQLKGKKLLRFSCFDSQSVHILYSWVCQCTLDIVISFLCLGVVYRSSCLLIALLVLGRSTVRYSSSRLLPIHLLIF
jgi:hypothetical protein